MVVIPNVLPTLEAGEVPGQIAAACKLYQVEAEDLLSWSLRPDAATLILPDGRKVVFPIAGRWINLPLPWLLDDGKEKDSAVKHLPPLGSFDPPAVLPEAQAPKTRRKK